MQPRGRAIKCKTANSTRRGTVPELEPLRPQKSGAAGLPIEKKQGTAHENAQAAGYGGPGARLPSAVPHRDAYALLGPHMAWARALHEAVHFLGVAGASVYDAGPCAQP